MKSTDNKSLDKQKLNLSLSRILQLDERDYGLKVQSYKGKKLSIDDIPTKENSYRGSPSSLEETSSKILNFKEFYENSKIEVKSTKNNRSKSSFDRGSQPLQNKLVSMIKPALISYNINEYLPSTSNSKLSINRSTINNSFIAYNGGVSTYLMPHQPSAKNVFQDNHQYLQVSQLAQSPNTQHQQSLINLNHQCTCGALSQQRQSSCMLQTQRSACSCQYSQSSACQSSYASPISTYSKQGHNNNNHNHHHQHTGSRVQLFSQNGSSQPNLNLQLQSQANKQQPFVMHNYQRQGSQALLTSNENTPFKQLTSLSSQVQQFQNQQHQPSSYLRSPVLDNGQQNTSNNRLFEDRSISFLKSSDKKKTGYNTDDLIRDSESEVDLNQVSTILQEVQMNLKEGISAFMNQQQQQHQQPMDNERAMREELAMKILQQNQVFAFQGVQNTELNQSQIKTIKQSQLQEKGPFLTLDSLQISNINQPNVQTPLSQFDTNSSNTFIDFNNQQTNKVSRNQQQQQQPTHLQLLQQHYQSPCFNSFEDTSLNLFTQQPHQNQQNPLQVNTLILNSNSEQSMKQNYQSVPLQPQLSSQSSTSVNDKKKRKKSKTKKTLRQKLTKKNYNEEEYSHRKQETKSSNSSSSSNSESNDSESSDREERKEKSKSSSQESFGNKVKQDIKKSNKEISIQAQNEEIQISNMTDSVIQTEKLKSDASCQYEPPISQEQYKKFQMLPPQQKKTQHQAKLSHYTNQVPPSKSAGYSFPSSKNSTINNQLNHFHSQNPSGQDQEDYYLQIDDESIQHHQSITGGNSCGTTTNKMQINMNHVNNLQPGNHFSQPNILLSPYPNNQNYADHFKSQCSEVIIRGSSETDISNKIARMKNLKNGLLPQGGGNSDNPSSRFFRSQSNYHQNSHQISGCQSIVNIGGVHSRSQFTSIDTHSYSPPKNGQHIIVDDGNVIQLQNLRPDLVVESSYEANDRERMSQQQLLAGDTFMHNQKTLYENFQSQRTDEDEEAQFYAQQQQLQEYQDSKQQFISIESGDGMMQNHDGIQMTENNQQQTDEEFNYTINLNELQNLSQSQLKKSQPGQFSQRPPIYQSPNQPQFYTNIPQQHNQHTSNPYLNNTGSTAGFPQLYGNQFSQQTGRKSSVNSSFHSHNIKNSNSQTSLQTSQRSYSIQGFPLNKQRPRKSFLEQVIFIQRHIRDFLQRRNDEHDNEEISEIISSSQNIQGFFGDSTIQKPIEESLSNISAQLLNSLKQSLGNSNNIKHIKPSDQSYQKNILESLNLTTGNTFVKDTRHFNQGLLKERTQVLGNSSNLVLYSGSTHDNRVNPFSGNAHVRNSDQLFLGNGQLDTQQSYGKPPLYDYELVQKDQMSPNNNSGMLNLTEESNSGIFKLTPLASQNVTQKTHNIQAYNQTSQLNGCGTTESNNLNYSYSEMESEWCNHLQKDTVSPMSVNTTSSKMRNLNGTKPGQRIANHIQNNIMFQRSGSVQSEQIVPLNSNQLQSKQTQKIRIEDCGVQSPLSMNQIASTRSAANLLSRQEQMLNILKSQDYHTNDQNDNVQPNIHDNIEETQNISIGLDQTQQSEYIDAHNEDQQQLEWKLLAPMRQGDLDNLLMAILTQNDNIVMTQA